MVSPTAATRLLGVYDSSPFAPTVTTWLLLAACTIKALKATTADATIDFIVEKVGNDRKIRRREK